MAKEISKTLIVGLGGTGQSVIRDIKKRLFRRYGEIPSLVKFVSFDTDDNEYQDTAFEYYYGGKNCSTKRYNISQEEFKKIARPSIDVLRADQNCAFLNFDELQKIYGLANAIGANGYRVMGRAHFLYNASSIMTLLSNTVTNLRNAQLAQHEQANGYSLANNGITVYVIASLAGVTGSSSFLDISRMLQHAGIDVLPHGAQTPTDTILGMFFMPSFFSRNANTPNVKINTYVALSELDYLLGLNDDQTYPDGCLEKENDMNIYGQYQSYKSVRYSNVYLIDEKTKKANSHSFAEAAGYVASFIAASIAADGQALNSCYSNSTHRLHDVEGKKQLYSGLGYSEMRFDRQNLVKYLLNRQLREVLSGFKSENLDADRIADNFISSNKLNEGVMSQGEDMEDTRSQLNELTDAIYLLNDAKFSIPMGAVPTGKDAANQIETNKDKFLNKIIAAANEQIKAFAPSKKSILKALEELLAKYQAEKGFGQFPDLAKRLKSAFNAMKAGLEDEIVRHNQAEKDIETKLKKFKANIAENDSKGFLGIGNKQTEQKDAMKSYARLVDNIGNESTDTLMRIKLEIARKQEAINIYTDLIKIVESFYNEEVVEMGSRTAVQISGSAIDVQQTYDALKSTVESEFLEYSYSKSAKNETIFVDAYFKEYFETHQGAAFTLNEQAKDKLDNYVQKLLSNKQEVNKQLVAEMRKFLFNLLNDNELIKRIQREEMSLDQLFVHCFGNASDIEDDHDTQRYPHLALFGQIETLFDSLWQYLDFRGNTYQPVELQCVVGVNDTNDHLLNSEHGYKAYLPSGHNYQFINVGDPDRIIFILQETAIPGFKMKDAVVWKDDYKTKKDHTYSFTDKRLEEIDMLFPDTTDEMADIAWAYGWLYGLIASVDRRIQVKPSHSYLSKTMQVAGNSGYLDYFAVRQQRSSNLDACHRTFVKDQALYSDIYEQVMKLMDADKNGTIIKIKHWVNDELLWDGRGKMRSSMDERERLTIQSEVAALTKRFARLNSAATNISLDQFGKIVCTDSLGLLAEAERAYQENAAGKSLN